MDVYFRWFGQPGSVILTSLLSTFALLMAFFNPTPVRWICFAAMALSSIGDIFLARIKSIVRFFPDYFTIGAAFFMAAHILYAICFCMKIRFSGQPFLNGGAILAVCIGIAAAAVLIYLSLSTGSTKTLPLILVYALIIFSNCASVLSYAFSQKFSSFSAIVSSAGVISFLLSDLVIGLGIAGKIHRFDHLIWWLYPIGQILLILGV